MTFKAKPVVKRAQRPSWEGQDRRNLYLNIGFGVVVAAAVIILVVASGLSWYNDHLSPVGSVDGQSITKDDFRDRYLIETWRLDQAEQATRTAVVAGHLAEAEGQSQEQIISQQRDQLPSVTLERLIDNKIQAKLAVEEGVTVTAADIDARLLEAATTPELRHAWVIEVKPETGSGAAAPTAAQKAAARAKAEAALKDLQGGKAWEEIAQSVSTDASSAAKSGDLGWVPADNTQLDEAYVKAIFSAEVNTPTAVIEGADGRYRIGRVTETSPESVDTEYQAKLTNDGIDLAKYRTVLQGDVIRQKLEDKILAQVSAPGPQRHVLEIKIAEAQANPALLPDAIKVRHILYSPKDSPSDAGALDAADPAWKAAEDEATATYNRLKADPSLFDSIARTESDETSDLGDTGTGGKLPYFDSSSQVDEAFKAAIMAPGLQPGQLLPPVKSAFGWHVIQVMYRPPDVDWLTSLKVKADAGADFGVLARNNSEATTAGVGGDLGWIAMGQLDERQIAGIFGATVGSTSNIIAIPGDGIYLFKVLAEERRTPAGRQLDELTASAFTDWYTAKKATAVITRDESIVGPAT